jgi:SAM-dependent methyltransferase
LLEVIEHLEEPIEALRRIARWLKPKGTLLLSTPNFDSLFRRLHGPRWWVVNCPEEHVVFFTAATLRSALHDTGFEVLSSRSRGFDIAGMFRAFRQRGRNGAPDPAPVADYYASRRTNERLKAMVRALRMAGPARAAKRVVEALCAARWSPLRHLGEQLVFFCARSDRP